MQNAKMGEAMHQLEQQLVDGHWVLAFENSEQAQAAHRELQSQASAMHGLLKEVLSPLLL